jgi:hypothetical protein
MQLVSEFSRNFKISKTFICQVKVFLPETSDIVLGIQVQTLYTLISRETSEREMPIAEHKLTTSESGVKNVDMEHF